MIPLGYYAEDYSEVYPTDISTINKNITILVDETIGFLYKPEEIEKMVKEQIDEEIIDCEIVLLIYLWRDSYNNGIIVL